MAAALAHAQLRGAKSRDWGGSLGGNGRQPALGEVAAPAAGSMRPVHVCRAAQQPFRRRQHARLAEAGRPAHVR